MTKIKLLLLPILFTLLTLPVFAVGKPDNPGNINSQEKRELAQARLDEAKLKSCQARENSIMKRAERLGNLAANMLEKFDAITERVKEFYETKVVPDGNTVENYDDLVADIDAKKEAAQASLDNAQDAISAFSCDSDDPKGLLTQYREDMQDVKSALKDYRTSIKNLIVAVHTAAGEAEGENTNE